MSEVWENLMTHIPPVGTTPPVLQGKTTLYLHDLLLRSVFLVSDVGWREVARLTDGLRKLDPGFINGELGQGLVDLAVSLFNQGGKVPLSPRLKELLLDEAFLNEVAKNPKVADFLRTLERLDAQSAFFASACGDHYMNNFIAFPEFAGARLNPDLSPSTPYPFRASARRSVFADIGRAYTRGDRLMSDLGDDLAKPIETPQIITILMESAVGMAYYTPRGVTLEGGFAFIASSIPSPEELHRPRLSPADKAHWEQMRFLVSRYGKPGERNNPSSSS